METINDRLEQVINALFNGNKAAFAKSIDLPPTGMSNYIGNKRRSIPSSEIASKIVSVLGVDANWLLTGEGDMLKVATAEQSNVVRENNVTGSEIELLRTQLEEKERTILKKSERIECIINALFKGNKSRFAKLLGVKPQTINTWLTRDTFDIERVYSCCPQLNPHWLLTGEGEMLKAPQAEQSIVAVDLTHVEGPVSVSQSTTKPEPADSAVLRARLAAAEDLVQALRAQLLEKEQTAAALRQIIDEKQKLINLLEHR